MGFSITAYKKLIAVDAIFDAEGTPIDPKTKAPIENWVKGYSSNEFPNQANDFTDQGIWKHSGSITFFLAPMTVTTIGLIVWRSWRATRRPNASGRAGKICVSMPHAGMVIQAHFLN